MQALLSAFIIVTSFVAILYWGLWGMPLDGWPHSLASLWPILALQWLYCGLFITAHDACHGSVAPASARLNDAIGRLCAALYAGFDFDALRREHHLHHRHAGTDADPDFYGAAQGHVPLWRWGLRFAWHYTRPAQWLVMIGVSQVLMHGVGIEPWRVIVYWAVPAWLSALQLFYFGTYLPHRPDSAAPFVDRHRTRDSGFGVWGSLLSCYHFGYHQVHHERPHVPWFALPAARRQSMHELASTAPQPHQATPHPG